MTPRTEVEALPLTATLDQALNRVMAGSHSRMLVYDGSLDEVVGVLHVRDLFRVVGHAGEPFDLRTLLRPVLTVPESKPADDLLEEMRAARRQLGVVIDEYGGTAGIITLEDLIEALVGRIEDEPPLGSDLPTLPEMQPEPDGSVLLDGLTRLAEFEELTGTRLPEAIHEEVATVGGLVMERLGRVPGLGDEVTVGTYKLRVEELDGRRAAKVRLLPAPQDAAVTGGPGGNRG
jgi:CBS domain containing-hemolysin-like protein